MQQIDFTRNSALFLRAVRGDHKYSNLSLFDEAGDIFFHVSFRWDRGEAYSNTRVSGRWNEEVRILDRLDGEASILLHRTGDGDPSVIFSDASERLVPSATPVPSEARLTRPCTLDCTGDFAFISVLDPDGTEAVDFLERPQAYVPVQFGGALRLVDRDLLGSASLFADQALCEAMEAAVSAGELRKIGSACLTSPGLGFAAEILAENAVADEITLIADKPEALAATLRANGIGAGLKLVPGTGLKAAVGAADLVAGRAVCALVPEQAQGMTLFSREAEPLALPALERRLEAGQALCIQTGDWTLKTPDPRELGGLEIGLDVCIAAYNSEAYLEECVASTLATESRRINAVIVNDGSTDGTEKLARALAEKDDRVRVITKPNGGCASARNCGRRHSKATHITFVDADDFVDEGFFEHLFNLALHSGNEIVQAGFAFYDHDSGASTDSYEPKAFEELEVREFGDLAVRQVSAHQLMMGQPAVWRRVYRRDFLDAKKITFPENVRAFDDYYFQMRSLHAARDVLHLDGPLYRYRQHAAQDIKQADERHFYELYMFRKLMQAAIEEGWDDFRPLMQSVVNCVNWTVGKLRPDLVGPFLEAAAEAIVCGEKALGAKLLREPAVELIHHPDFRVFHADWTRRLERLPPGYWAAYVAYGAEHPITQDWSAR